MSKLGKRYECAVCGTVVLCVTPGPEEYVCDGAPMTEKAMEQLPSSD